MNAMVTCRILIRAWRPRRYPRREVSLGFCFLQTTAEAFLRASRKPRTQDSGMPIIGISDRAWDSLFACQPANRQFCAVGTVFITNDSRGNWYCKMSGTAVCRNAIAARFTQRGRNVSAAIRPAATAEFRLSHLHSANPGQRSFPCGNCAQHPQSLHPAVQSQYSNRTGARFPLGGRRTSVSK